MSRNPTGASGAAPLDEEQLTKLRALVKPGGGGLALADFEGVGGPAMARALAGLPVRPATRALIRLGLERLAAEEKNLASVAAPPKNAFPWSPHLTPEMKAAFASGASALVRAPVCPRCLGLTPGTPAGGTPETHPGPFTEGLCAACSRAVERDLRKEGRIQAADFEAKRPEKAAKQRSVEKLNQERRAAWESMTRRQIALYGGTLEQRGDTYVVKAPPETAPILVALMRITNPNVLVEVS